MCTSAKPASRASDRGRLGLTRRELAHEGAVGFEPCRRVRDDAFDLLETRRAADQRASIGS